MNKDFLLIKANACYADEFDLEAFCVATVEEWDKYCRLVKTDFAKFEAANPVKEIFKGYSCRENEYEVYFGTNEAMQWTDYKDWLSEFTVTKISAAEADTLAKLFTVGKRFTEKFSFGTGSGCLFELDDVIAEKAAEAETE